MTNDLESFLIERLAFTEASRGRIAVAVPEPSHLRRVADDFMEMIDAYIADARHFQAKGDLARAVEAVSYAYGWMDAGARLGLFDVGNDGNRFTLAD